MVVRMSLYEFEKILSRKQLCHPKNQTTQQTSVIGCMFLIGSNELEISSCYNLDESSKEKIISRKILYL